MLRVAVFGLGEAGGEIAADLAVAGVEVRGYDPRNVATPSGVIRCETAPHAVIGAHIICALTASGDAVEAMRQAVDSIPTTSIYADFSTASAGLKQQLGATAFGIGVAFVDVALMSPVPGKGLRTPALASGTGAHRFVELFAGLGMPIEYSGEREGIAATRKLLRSVVIKGMAALMIESLRAAEAAGLADETWENLVAQFTAADETFLRRIISGTGTHALRRLHEMEATEALLRELGVDPVMTTSTAESLRRLVAGEDLPAVPGPR
jgi:3-hydroxyisobutyrate dehydrogenase-like beta-hydroxyacid dehydrogenase